MDKVYLLITSYILHNEKRNGINDGFSHLDHLFQKSLRYNHHKENYKIGEGVISTGLKLRKDPVFLPVTDGFQQKWEAVLFNVEGNLLVLLLVQSNIVIKKLKLDSNKEPEIKFPD